MGTEQAGQISEKPTKTWGDVLSTAKIYIGARESSLLPKFNEVTRKADPFVAIHWVIGQSEFPPVKAETTRLVVDHLVEEEKWHEAVRLLAYAEASKLPNLDAYGREFVLKLVNQAKEGANHFEAWMVAEEMAENRLRIVKPLPDKQREEEDKNYWEKTRKETFAEYAESVLSETPNNPSVYDPQVFNLYCWMSEHGGFNSDLGQRLAKAVVAQEMGRGRNGKHFAEKYARKAGIIKDYKEMKKEEGQKKRERLFTKLTTVLKKQSKW